MHTLGIRRSVSRTAKGSSLPVEATEPRLGQVFLNLIVNAAQALEGGRAESHEIRISTARVEGNRIRIEI
jgi:two-component system NtrC family sensor kinase